MIEATEVEDRAALFERLRHEPYDPGPTENAAVPDPEDPTESVVGEMKPPRFDPPAVAYFDVGGIAVPLRHPFETDGRAFYSLTLHPPRLDHVQAFERGLIPRIDVIAEMASVDASVLGSLRWPDAERLLAIADLLMPDL